ncbi:Clavaminate synthase-like protein [Russula emetica]|nr:Clavaminate synthase-like protein [Russula emetica]
MYSTNSSEEAAVKAASTLPIIDIAPWIEGHDHKGRLSTAAAIHAACLEFGFFYLDVSAFVSPDEPEELSRLAREFFGLPQEEKDKMSLNNQDCARGYQRLRENVTSGLADNHEAIDFYRPVENPDKGKPLWGENQWPSVPEFREKYEAWINKMKTLGLIVMHAMAMGLGIFWVLRIIGYPPLPNDDDGFSCGAHKDYGCLTFLWADPTRGALQVFLPQQFLAVENPGTVTAVMCQEGIEEGMWITVDPIPGCMVCNIGEMWEVWTNGLYRSTVHRVIHRGSNYRIPFFFEPNFDTEVAPLEAARRIQKDLSLLGVKHHTSIQVSEKKYEPVVYGDFLRKKVSNNFDGGGRYN